MALKNKSDSSYVPACSLIVSPRSLTLLIASPINLNGALKLPSPSIEAAAFTHQFGPSNVGIADTISENGPSKFEESTALTIK